MMKYHLDEKTALEVLDRVKWGTLCTNGEDGYPYGTPINYVRIGRTIYFHGRSQGEKVSNLTRDGRCCLTVTDLKGYQNDDTEACATETLFQSVIVRGILSVVEDPEEKITALRAITDSIVPELKGMPIDSKKVDRTGVFRLNIESITGKYRDPEPRGTIYN